MYIVLAAIVEGKQKYTKETTNNVHLSTVILDVDSVPANSKKSTQLWVNFEGSDHLIAVLSKQIPQFALDVGFAKNSKIEFFIKGGGIVHLNGYEGMDNEK